MPVYNTPNLIGIYRDPSIGGIFRRHKTQLGGKGLAVYGQQLDAAATLSASVLKTAKKQINGSIVLSPAVGKTAQIHFNVGVATSPVLDTNLSFHWLVPITFVGAISKPRIRARQVTGVLGTDLFYPGRIGLGVVPDPQSSLNVVNLSQGLTLAATLAKFNGKLIAPGLTITPDVVKFVSGKRTFAIVSNFSMTLVKAGYHPRSFAAAMTLTPIEALRAFHLRALSQGATLTPLLINTVPHFRTFAGATTLTPAQVRQFLKKLIFNYTIFTNFGLGQAISLGFARTFALTGAVRRVTAKAIGGSVSLNPALTRPSTTFRAFSGSTALSGALTQQQVGSRRITLNFLFDPQALWAVPVFLTQQFDVLENMIIGGAVQRSMSANITINNIIKRKINYPMVRQLDLAGDLSHSNLIILAAQLGTFDALSAYKLFFRHELVVVATNPTLFNGIIKFNNRQFSYTKLVAARSPENVIPVRSKLR